MADEMYEYDVSFKLPHPKNNVLYPDILDLLTDQFYAGYGWGTIQEVNSKVNVERTGDKVTQSVVIENDDDGLRYEATHETVRAGLQLMLNTKYETVDGKEKINTFYTSVSKGKNSEPTEMVAFKLLAGEYDAGTIDAGDADCIVQLGLFGEVRYA